MMRIDKVLVLSLLFSVIFCCSVRCYCDEAIIKRINGVSNEHPRLFLTSKGFDDLKTKVEKDNIFGEIFAGIKKSADAMLKEKPLKRKKKGKRLLSVSREVLNRVNHLAMVYRLTGEEKYLQRCKQEMVAAASFTDWNPSHFLDVAEMATALGIGYDWLYNELDGSSRKIIKKAIIEKGIKPAVIFGSFFDNIKDATIKKGIKPYIEGGWWVNSHHNWNQVCHGGLTVAALAVMEDDKELASKIINQAIKKIPLAMKEYAPDGAYPEGAGYWVYGTGYNVLMISALESVLGTDFGLSSYEGFLDSGRYMLHVTGPSGLIFNYSDAGSGRSIKPALYWVSNKLGDSSILWFEKAYLDERLAKKQSLKGRFLPFLLIWAKDFNDISKPEKLSWTGHGRAPVGFHRTGWEQNDTFLAIKGGSGHTNHAHMDVGSFIMEAEGVRWAIDLGAQGYYSLESKKVNLWDGKQDGQRWTIFRLNNFSHNTLVVDGKLQQIKGFAPIIDSGSSPDMRYTVVDMSSVYQGQLAAVKRGAALMKDGSVLIQDDIKTLDRETKIRWGMVTKAKVGIIDNNTAILKQDSKQLRLEVLSPDKCKLKIFETEKPVHSYDVVNKGTCMIGFEDYCAGSKDICLRVLLQPEGKEGTGRAFKPLIQWGD